MSEVEILKDKNYAPANLGKVCVLGLGKTGAVVANYFCDLLGKRVSSVHVFAGEKKAFGMQTADKILARGATVSFDDKEVNESFDLCVTSPGISENDNLIISAKEKCSEVISEVEFAWREADSSSIWIAVTGTNGKTTTTSLITYILEQANKHAVSVGNIGNVALQAVSEDQRKSVYEHIQFYVLEISSYQLAMCDKFAPKIAVLLNISPDHLEWHNGFENYTKAKLSIFDNAEIAIVNADDPVIQANMNIIKSKQNKKLILNKSDGDISLPQDLKIIGNHNQVNARAAYNVCEEIGLAQNQIKQALVSFSPLEHRLEPCGIVAGVRLFNDSKATNIDSVLVAINSFPKGKAIFMIGGKDKNTQLDGLVESCKQNLKGVVIYGQAQDRFYDAFKDKVGENFLLLRSQNMKTAFKLAMENAYPGDFVVLSPACSSFDEFENFEQRGEVFKNLVEKCK